ncbi:hypothetical protein MTO96_040141 [Rhipicephalus appendiculatus]
MLNEGAGADWENIWETCSTSDLPEPPRGSAIAAAATVGRDPCGLRLRIQMHSGHCSGPQARCMGGLSLQENWPRWHRFFASQCEEGGEWYLDGCAGVWMGEGA